MLVTLILHEGLDGRRNRLASLLPPQASPPGRPVAPAGGFPRFARHPAGRPASAPQAGIGGGRAETSRLDEGNGVPEPSTERPGGLRPSVLAAALSALGRHRTEYLLEAAELGTFMVSACLVTALLEHPGSAARQAIESDLLRRALIGLGMGLTAVALIYSPWGRRSGAHFNPAVTLTFLRLGKVDPWDATFYVAAQFAGGVAGVALAAALVGGVLADPSVNYVTTVPGRAGVATAFAAELLISFVLMSVVLRVSNAPRLARLTGLCAGALVATFISLEAPLSGMSMNPARTFGSAFVAGSWTALWLYFTAPPLGMLLAAELYRRRKGRHAVRCAKLNHPRGGPCIFRCGYTGETSGATPAGSAPGGGAGSMPAETGSGRIRPRSPAS